MTPKILYHPKPGTTGFFLMRDVPQAPNMDFEGHGGSPREGYEHELAVCENEAIKNGEITNHEILPDYTETVFKDDLGEWCIIWRGNEPYHIQTLKDGDIFDLPKGLNVEVKKKLHCDEYHAHTKKGCYITSIMLVPDVEGQSNANDESHDYSSNEFLLHLVDVVACFTAEQNMYYATPVRQELIQKAKDGFTSQGKSEMSNESIKSPEEILRCELGINIGSEEPVIYHNTDRPITQSEAIKCMQFYSDQNLTEYKRRLKEELTGSLLLDPLVTRSFINLIDSIDLNKKP